MTKRRNFKFKERNKKMEEQKEMTQDERDQDMWDMMDDEVKAMELKKRVLAAGKRRPAIVRPAMRKSKPINKWNDGAKADWYRERMKTISYLLSSGIYDSVFWMIEESIVGLIRPIGLWRFLWVYMRKYYFKQWKNRLERIFILNPQEMFRFGKHYWMLLHLLEDQKEYSKKMAKPLEEMTDYELECKNDLAITLANDAKTQVKNADDEREVDHWKAVHVDRLGELVKVQREIKRREDKSNSECRIKNDEFKSKEQGQEWAEDGYLRKEQPEDE
ncbi:MAG: hypothetical protein WCL06_00065 [Bacteroidota bacterium]